MEIEMTVTKTFDVKYLQAECGVRYWEDATVNGEQDESGTLIPLRKGDCWCPVIDLESGVIQDWPAGVVADIHYKVCDAGIYRLLDSDHKVVKEIDDYVPAMLSPGGDGWGDYVIMTVGGDGKIADWKPSFDKFTDD